MAWLFRTNGYGVLVRIVGLLEPALIGAIIVVTSYYLVIDFRHAAGESVIAVVAADSAKL